MIARCGKGVGKYCYRPGEQVCKYLYGEQQHRHCDDYFL